MALSDRSAFFIGLPRRVQLTPQQPWCLVLANAARGIMKIALALRTVADLEVQGTLVILCIDLDMQQEFDPVVQKFPFCNTAEWNVGTVTLVGQNGWSLGGHASNAKAKAGALLAIFVIGRAAQSRSQYEIWRATSRDPLKCPRRQRSNLWNVLCAFIFLGLPICTSRG